MRKRKIYFLFAIGLILIPIAGLTFSLPYIFNTSKGTIEVNWGNPTGLKLNGVSKGDKIDLTYSAEIEVNVFLLTKDEANEFRSPSMYKDPLPQPLMSGVNGTLKIEIAENGDYELLFLPDGIFNTFEVDYEVERYIKKEISIYVPS